MGGGGKEPDTVKAAVINAFFDGLMIENAALAVKRKAPADYRRAKEIWLGALENVGVSGLGKPTGQPAPQKAGNKRGSQGRSGSGGGGSGAKPVGEGVAMLGLLFVCHRYNESGGCPRFLMAQGCRGKNNQVFAHNCNAKKQDGSFCLGAHPRHQHV